MEFRMREISVRFRHPQKEFEEVETTAEVRWDPLTRRTSRITSHKHLNLSAEKELPDISEPLGQSRQFCVFCKPHVDNLTPKLPSGIFDTDRLEHKGTLLFPNIFPYAAASGVCIYGPEHHYIEVGQFDPELQAAAIENCCNYMAAHLRHDPSLVYSSIIQNYLPPSGGSFIHPHIQAQIDNIPHQHMLDVAEAAKRYHLRNDSNYWNDLIEEEEKRGERWIGRTGEWSWFTPFAPGGFKEVAAVLPGRRSVSQCTEREILDLARGIDNAQKLYRSQGANSFNFALYSIDLDEPAWTLYFRMIIRANWTPWYRSDRTFHEVLLGENAVPETPEKVAGQMRPFFTGG